MLRGWKEKEIVKETEKSIIKDENQECGALETNRKVMYQES